MGVEGVEELGDLPRALEAAGYANTGELDGPGTFAVRGGTLDVFPGNLTFPVRLDFFGDELDEIRRIVPATGQTIASLPSVEIYPVSEFPTSPRALADARRALEKPALTNPALRDVLEKLEGGLRFDGADVVLPFLYKKPVTLGAYAGAGTCAALIEPRSLFDDAVHAADDIAERARGTNIALAGLFAPIVLMALWRFRTVRYNIDGVFRLAFPLIVVALGILPFAAGIPFVILAALLYMTYSFLSLSVQALSIQISHDYGIDPVFCLSFQTLVCVVAQGVGYLLGACAPAGESFGVSPYAVIALGSVCFLALALYVTRALHPSQSEKSRPVEFLSLASGRVDCGTQSTPFAEIEEEDDGAASVSEETIVRPRYEDKTALRCDLIGRKYALSQREIEVMLLFARGNTISSIAGELFISDNTVKTHMRRLYAKLGIHKKQELFALINSYVE